jgi:putative membrane protein
MRWIYLAVIILFAAATIIFALQNLEVVTMSFLGLNARVPLALLVAVAYLLGAATGGSLLALLRQSYEGSRRSIANSSQMSAYEEGYCHAPSHVPRRKPLLASRFDRWTRASVVNRFGRSNSFGHHLDRPRLRLRVIADPIACGSSPPWPTHSMRIGRAEAKHCTEHQKSEAPDRSEAP